MHTFDTKWKISSLIGAKCQVPNANERLILTCNNIIKYN